MERKASWVIFEIYSPSTLQRNTFKKTVKVDTSSFFLRWKLTRRVILNLAPLDPTKQTVEQVQKIDMWGYFCNL